MNGNNGDEQRRQKPASSINCKDFDSTKNDFEIWVKKFEKAVKLATNVRDDNAQELHYLFKEWLPLKLDEEATSHLDTIDVDRENWASIKSKLEDLLIDPHERQRWKNREVMITWDGIEPLHVLATRVKRMVNKFDKHLPLELRKQEYYSRFRTAFERRLMRVIDMACPEGSQTIESARDALMRFTLSTPNKEDTPDSSDPYKAVSFAGAQKNPDKATSLENSMAAMATQMENMAITMRSMDDRARDFDDRLRALEDKERERIRRREQRQNSYGNQNGNQNHRRPHAQNGPSSGRRGYEYDTDEEEEDMDDQEPEHFEGAYGPVH